MVSGVIARSIRGLAEIGLNDASIRFSAKARPLMSSQACRQSYLEQRAFFSRVRPVSVSLERNRLLLCRLAVLAGNFLLGV
jgi:hypothetical protein